MMLERMVQVAGHFVGQWAGDTLSYQDEGMSNPSKAAEYCLARFQKLMQAGSRRLPPLHAEINAVEVCIVFSLHTSFDSKVLGLFNLRC